MDASPTPTEFNAEALAQVAPTLQAIIDQGVLAGAVTLVWRKGEIEFQYPEDAKRANTIRRKEGDAERTPARAVAAVR